MPVAGFGVDRRDDPVLGHPAGDAKPPVLGLLQVLADHRGEQLGRLGDHRIEPPAVEDPQTSHGVLGPGVDERLAGSGSSQSICGLAVLA